jgi:hypothetical protein
VINAVILWIMCTLTLLKSFGFFMTGLWTQIILPLQFLQNMLVNCLPSLANISNTTNVYSSTNVLLIKTKLDHTRYCEITLVVRHSTQLNDVPCLIPRHTDIFWHYTWVAPINNGKQTMFHHTWGCIALVSCSLPLGEVQGLTLR